MNDFSGRVVLITGAGRGAGRALAEAFAARGALVAANDISPVNVEAVVREINQHGGIAKAYIDDVAKKVAAQALIKNVEDDFGGVDILVNHAAVEPHGPLLEMDEWDWHRTLDVNLTGAFLMIQSVGRTMRAKGRGVIINIVPEAGREVRKEAAAYRVSMAGLVELSREAEKELSRFGIRVYTVINTDQIADEVISLCFSALTQMEEK